MEQTRRDTVIELLCAGHRPAAIIKLLKYPKRTVYDITKKWEESGMSKRKEHKPRSDRICTPTFVAGLKRSIKVYPGTPMSILARKRGVHLSSSLDGLCGFRDPVYIPAGLGARPHGQTCAVLAEDECAQLLGLQHLAPQQPRPEPMRLLLVYATHHSNMASLKASIKSEINKLDPAEVSTDCKRFRRRLEDILEAEGGQIE
ncbi:Transposable element tcb2 transposase [Caligus rogercresseyi]|uniref:Transposable element tcb2 transposase n=1 Tax=Caligus rogercresseyi TaxID=217165 RepID=A0A7T8HG45_CALRO|nr:Transposable element tcb2 transposase [Caligus rogercresseyi]